MAVPNERLRVLSDIGRFPRIVPLADEFADIEGLVKGASEGDVGRGWAQVGCGCECLGI